MKGNMMLEVLCVSTEAVKELRNCVKCTKMFSPLFSVVRKGSHGNIVLPSALLRPISAAMMDELTYAHKSGRVRVPHPV